jgi:hypothetical protein
VPTVLEGGDVAVQGPPVVADDDDAALGHELTRDTVPFQAAGVGMPGDPLLVLGLAQALEQPDAALVGPEVAKLSWGAI